MPIIVGAAKTGSKNPSLKKTNAPINDVIPIIKLLVAIETFNGTLIILFIIGTNIEPPPTPNNPEKIPPKKLNDIPFFIFFIEYFIVLF